MKFLGQGFCLDLLFLLIYNFKEHLEITSLIYLTCVVIIIAVVQVLGLLCDSSLLLLRLLIGCTYSHPGDEMIILLFLNINIRTLYVIELRGLSNINFCTF